MADGRGGSGGAAVSLLGTFDVLGSAAWGRPTATLRLARLRARLPSGRVGLARTTILGRTRSTTVVGDVSITLRRGLTVWTRWDHRRGVGRVTGTRWDHAWLTVAHHTTSARGREVAARRVVHWAIHVTTRDTSSSGLLHADLVTLSDLAL